MGATLLNWCDRIIRYGFYALFFLVPLIFTNNTSELFELNKIWLTWEVTLFILVAWVMKMMIHGQLRIQRTVLDIPILLFALSQIIATVLSLDPHTSFWGYYSRFNGGLLSTLTYIFLYYAFVSNLTKAQVLTLLKISLASGLIVALWGLPSHFGKDPTCLMFRGTFDVTCWTDAFKPTIRIFSTLGQPAWMAAYMNILLPLCIAFAFFTLPYFRSRQLQQQSIKQPQPSLQSALISWKFLSLLLLTLLFYLDLIFTNTRAGIIAFWFANILFWSVLFYRRFLPARTLLHFALFINGMFLLLNIFFGTTFVQLDRYTIPSLLSQTQASPTEVAATNPTPPPQESAPADTFGGTDSGKIRQIVWSGAIDIWKANPIFGSGVETFAFAYYRHRPPEHNLTSEWDYLYNKAHNEYLNYLATTGILGLGSYLLFIGFFLFIIAKYLIRETDKNKEFLLIAALVAAFITILITNFFGFSVVIINLYFFLIPAFIFIIEPKLLSNKTLLLPQSEKPLKTDLSAYQWTGITVISLITLYFLLVLIRFWYADVAYALGSNFNRVQEYQQAYLKLGEAVSLRPSEPIFKDEFASNNAVIASLLMMQPEASDSAEIKQQAQLLSEQAIGLSNEVVTDHPNNITFWKNRVRLFYALSQADKRYLPYAVDAIQHVHALAPTDAKVMYNYGALTRENGDSKKSAEILEQAILLKPDYRDAYYALAMAYNDQAVNERGQVIQPELRQKAIKQLQFILEHLSSTDQQVKELLTQWQKE